LGVLAVSGSVTVKELIVGVFFCGLLVMSVAMLNNLYLLKYFNFLQQILDIRNTGYGHLWASGLLIWQENFWFGAGTATYRDLCSTYQVIIPAINRCDNHPHNYFVQLLAETGIVGFVGFLALYSALVWNAVSTKGPSIGIWIIPLIFFFPLQSTGDFFGQWFNIMMWFTIGVTLCFVEIYQKDARQ
jgi:O-antigen ligase